MEVGCESKKSRFHKKGRDDPGTSYYTGDSGFLGVSYCLYSPSAGLHVGVYIQ